MGVLELKLQSRPPDWEQSLRTEDKVHPSSAAMASVGSFHSPTPQTNLEAKEQKQGQDWGQGASTHRTGTPKVVWHLHTSQYSYECYPRAGNKWEISEKNLVIFIYLPFSSIAQVSTVSLVHVNVVVFAMSKVSKPGVPIAFLVTVTTLTTENKTKTPDKSNLRKGGRFCLGSFLEPTVHHHREGTWSRCSRSICVLEAGSLSAGCTQLTLLSVFSQAVTRPALFPLV